MAQKPARAARNAWKWPVRLTALLLAAVLIYVFAVYESVHIAVAPSAYEGDAAAIMRDRSVRFDRANIALNTLIGSTQFLKKSPVGRALDILSARLGSKESYEVCYNSAAIKIAEGKYVEALPFIDACINSGKAADEEASAALWLQKGCLLSLMNAGDAALTALEKALALNPEAVDAYYVMMQIYVGREDLPRAIDCMKTYRASVDNEETRTVLGDLLAAGGRYAEADELYTLLVEGGEAGGHAQFMRGICRLQTGAYDVADSDFTACVRAGTEKAMSLYYRGVLRLKGGRYAEAEADFTAAIAQNREDAAFMELRYNRGVSRMAQDRYSDAAEDFQASYEAGEAVKDSLFYCGLCKLHSGDNERAIALFNACLENGGTLQELAYYRGMACLNLGYADQAAADFEASMEAEKLPGESAYYAGLCRMALGQYEAAAERFAKAIKRAADESAVPLADCLLSRGQCFRALERYGEAIEDFTACLELNPQDKTIRYYRGLCHQALGETALAEADLLAAVED